MDHFEIAQFRYRERDGALTVLEWEKSRDGRHHYTIRVYKNGVRAIAVPSDLPPDLINAGDILAHIRAKIYPWSMD